MGNVATPEALVARWDELCRDPSLCGLPCKIAEMDAKTRAYLAAGAREVWRVSETGTVHLPDPTKEYP